MSIPSRIVFVGVTVALLALAGRGAARWEASAASGKVRALSPDAMRADLDYLREKVLLQHSNPYLHVSREEFERTYQSVREGLDRPLDRLAFYRAASRLATSLRDGHTLVDPLLEDFHAYAAAGPVFPLEVAFAGTDLVVAVNHTSDVALAPGARILAINGRVVAQIVADYRTLIDDVHPLYDVYARLFRELFWLSYGAPREFDVSYAAGGAARTARVPGKVFERSGFNSYAAGGEPFAFRVLQPQGVGLLTMNSFSPADGYDAFLADVFARLRREGIGDLVIDVRRNGGGSGGYAQRLLAYLTRRPYAWIGAFYVKVTEDLRELYRRGDTHTDADTRALVMGSPIGARVDGLKDSGPVMVTPPPREDRFDGRTYVLTGNNTFSAAAMFAAAVKCNRLGLVIGGEPAQATSFLADAVPYTMPNSGLTFTVSFSEIHMPCERSFHRGIAPDVLVEQAAEDVGAGSDRVMAAALTRIETDRARSREPAR